MNQPNKAWEHFYGLREAKSDLVGFALFDRLEQSLEARPGLQQYTWKRREIENYLCDQRTLLTYSEALGKEFGVGPLFEPSGVMRQCIGDYVPPVALRDPADRWWMDTKASDDFLDRLFKAFFERLGLPNLMTKTDYHSLARHVSRNALDPEVTTVLDQIVEVSNQAKPADQ
jgi:hypothetical protein